MKIKSLILAFAAAALAICACNKDPEQTGTPSISVDGKKAVELAFDPNGGIKTIKVACNREWKMDTLSSSAKKWITVSGCSGVQSATSGQEVKIAVSANVGLTRSYDLTFTCGTSTAMVTVKQEMGDVKIITIKEFLENKDTVNASVIKGTVTEKITASTYWALVLKDSTASVTCPFPDNWDDYKDSIAVGKVVTICGTYEFYEKKSQDQLSDGIILKVESGEPEKGVIYSETFGNGFGKWTFDHKVLPAGVDSIWISKPSYSCVMASGYVNSTNYDSESWLVSPVIDLSAEETAYLEYEQAVNFFSSLDKAKEECVPMIREEGGSWAALTVGEWPVALSWTFKNTGSIDICAYAGKKIQFAFKYISTATKAGSWEVMNFKITQTKKEKPVDPGFKADLTWTINDIKSGFSAATDATYGKGFTITKDNLTASNYQYKSTTTAVTPSTEWRIYKSSVLILKSGGKDIKAVRLTCTAKDKCSALTPIAPTTLSCTVDTDALTIKIEGTASEYVLQAAAGQVRISMIEVDFVD